MLRQGPEAGRIAAPGQTVLVEARERILFEEHLAVRDLAFQPSAPPVLGRNYSNGDDVILQAGRVTEGRVSAARN